MEKRNHFSARFKTKSSNELQSIIQDEAFQEEAKLAAVWELERRSEASEEDVHQAEAITAEQERKLASELTNMRYRTFWHRLFAAIVDGLILMPVGWLANYIIGSDMVWLVMMGNLVNNLSPYVYSILFHQHGGQTIGKMVMGVRVVSFDGEGHISLKQAFMRDSIPLLLTVVLFIYTLILVSLSGSKLYSTAEFGALVPMVIISLLALLWTMLEIFTMLSNEKSRAFHDLIAKTVVVRT